MMRNSYASILEIKSGFHKTPMNLWDPFMLEDKEGTHIFFGTLFCKERNLPELYTLFYSDKHCNISSVTFGIGYGFQKKNKTDYKFRSQPVFLPSLNSNKWDGHYVETPSVVKKGRYYYLFYSAWRQSKNEKEYWKRYQIGVSRLKIKKLSKLLVKPSNRFKRFLVGPLIPANHNGFSFDSENTQEPTAIWNKQSKRFEVYYLGLRAVNKLTQKPLDHKEPLDDDLAQINEIGLGRKCFSINFEKIDCSSKEEMPMLTTRFDDLSKLDFVNMPEVIYRNNHYELYYTDFSSSVPTIPVISYSYQKVLKRSSSDGQNWSNPEVFYENSNPSHLGVHSPTVILRNYEETQKAVLGVQSWWAVESSSPQKCFEKMFALPIAKHCHNTSLLVID